MFLINLHDENCVEIAIFFSRNPWNVIVIWNSFHKFFHNIDRYSAIKWGHCEMSVQSLQSWKSWKSWKSRLRLVEIDTVDFLFGRLIYTCICTGENSEFTPPCGILGSCPMKKSSRCRSTFCRNPPQILQIGIFGLILFHLSWDKKFHRLFLFRFYNLSTFHFYFLIFIYLTFLENGGMLLSLFYWNEKSLSDLSYYQRRAMSKVIHSYYIIYDSPLVFHHR